MSVLRGTLVVSYGCVKVCYPGMFYGPYPAPQVDVFAEVAIMERLAGSGVVARLLDYGVDEESFVLVMQRYRMSLRRWRMALPADPAPQLRLYLRIFANVLRAVQVPESFKVSTAPDGDEASSPQSANTGIATRLKASTCFPTIDCVLCKRENISCYESKNFARCHNLQNIC